MLDISGDGSNNDGGLVTDMRYEALKERIVINGLPIMNDRPNPFGFPSEDRPRQVLPALRHRRAALLRRGRPATSRTFPAPCARSSCRRWPTSGRVTTSISATSGRSSDGTQLAQSGRRPVRGEADYTSFVRPEYELGCDVGERRSREFWQRRFGVTPD